MPQKQMPCLVPEKVDQLLLPPGTWGGTVWSWGNFQGLWGQILEDLWRSLHRPKPVARGVAGLVLLPTFRGVLSAERSLVGGLKRFSLYSFHQPWGLWGESWLASPSSNCARRRSGWWRMAMWSQRAVASTWRISRWCAWMVTDACWALKPPLLAEKCSRWFRDNCRGRKVPESRCITWIYRWCSTKL